MITMSVQERVGAAAVAAAIGCGPTVEDPIVRLATCGSDGPVRLLEHGPDASVSATPWQDRLIATVVPLDGTDEDRRAAAATWSVGPCGETPTLISEGRGVYEHGDLLLSCEPEGPAAGDVYRIDPNGQFEPTLLFADVDCSVVSTAHGWLAFDHGRGELLHHRDPDRTDVAAAVLATGIAGFDGACSLFNPSCDISPALEGRAAFAIDEDHQVVRLDLVTGESAVLAAGAAWARATPDGRKLWWSETSAAADAAARVHMRDLETGDDVVVYIGHPPNQWEWPYAFARVGNATEKSLLDLRTGAIHALDPTAWQLGRLSGTPLLVFTASSNVDLGSYAWLEAEHRLVELPAFLSCSAHAWGPLGFDELRPADCTRDRGELWSHPYDGGEPVHVASDVGRDFLHADPRLVWSTREEEIGREGWLEIGDLYAIDADGGRMRLDTDARLLFWLHEGLGGDVLYTVNDGDRTGLWRTAAR
jgi:hypothetical protein